jgi:hypothetical protein
MIAGGFKFALPALASWRVPEAPPVDDAPDPGNYRDSIAARQIMAAGTPGSSTSLAHPGPVFE